MDLSPVKLGGALSIQFVNSASDFHSELRGHEVFDSVSEHIFCGVLHIAELRLFAECVSEVWIGLEHPFHWEFDLIFAISKCPVVDVESIYSIVGATDLEAVLCNCLFRQVEQGEHFLDTVLESIDPWC